ncbi:hypothetical protein COW94_01450 [Candidatus Peregrinibacteria bacterium CG22_combo_CG10-13_8_21_14_all_44_10]|nr:MAG: hypothetical protein AUK45_00645 [Candidatus Peregrinibacteria bacterium CG2_30_44_17]PIP66498.1 MAG: hypothetical protein COW94_01450 [Candidatus Peregrinibacteria bacterium CG22_combo_CG10-13_8_21_14_all_44_10]PIS03863.1 MAG: hypothetical protein COT83_03740 [Candidatus Peregrinibacteria bacterium CG10_big_fil_rev_8_21_14_0_10_44_7]PIX80286.1 MAG: hypothetical protein COZ35_01220 [Candidatus Peregrinibacteria bacterium CG_4_10_14_3_um_filter_44_21]PJB89207.1 MAG: hypothetical protein 
MPLQDLIKEIEKIGDKKLKDLEKKFAEDLQAMEKQYKAKREEAVKVIEKKAEEATGRVKARAEMLANTERRKNILSKKREILDSVFVDTLSRLAKSPDYKKYLEALIKQATTYSEEGEIIPAKGKKAVTEDVISKTEYKIAEEGQFHGGFILKTGKVEYDFTFDSVIEKKLRDELETKVANILF